MEVRVDAIPGQTVPEDTFVSVRVGDVQKQSRYAPTRTYRFPDPGDDRATYGRIEVFQRVGHVTVDFDREKDGVAVLAEVPCEFSLGMCSLGLEVAVQNMRTKTADADSAKERKRIAKQRIDAAQEYLSQYRIEEVMAYAMKQLIRLKPKDPHAFLANYIIKAGANTSPRLSDEIGVGILPPIASLQKKPDDEPPRLPPSGLSRELPRAEETASPKRLSLRSGNEKLPPLQAWINNQPADAGIDSHPGGYPVKRAELPVVVRADSARAESGPPKRPLVSQGCQTDTQTEKRRMKHKFCQTDPKELDQLVSAEESCHEEEAEKPWYLTDNEIETGDIEREMLDVLLRKDREIQDLKAMLTKIDMLLPTIIGTS